MSGGTDSTSTEIDLYTGVFASQSLRGPMQSSRTGRPSLNVTPLVAPSASWEDAWLGFELDMRARNLSAATIRGRKSAILILARRMTELGSEPINVQRSTMRQYVVAELAARRNTGAMTIFNNLAAFWKWFAAEHGTESPMSGIPSPKGCREAPVAVLSPAQVKAILATCAGRTQDDTRNRAIIFLLLESGVRRSELCALKPEDLDLRGRTAQVRCGKGRKARTVVFGPQCAQALHRWLQKRPDGRRSLFTGTRGGDLTSSGLGQLLYRLGREAGIPGLRAHMFRHAWTHYLLESGMREHDIMVLAGWSSGRQLERYGSALAEQRAVTAGRNYDVARLVRES